MFLLLLLPGRRDQPPPGLIRGRLRTNTARRFATTLLALAIVILGAHFIRRRLGPDLAAVWLVALAPMAILVGAIRSSDRQGRAEVAAANWGLCLKCRYPLVHEPATALMRCPECGLALEPTIVERSWRWTYRHIPNASARRIDRPSGVSKQ